jgi:hypothetical protein
MAKGILRQYLVESFGLTAARAVLTQFGFAHGWRMAEAMQKEFRWASNEEWRRAGPHNYTLEGLFRTQPGSEDHIVPQCVDEPQSNALDSLDSYGCPLPSVLAAAFSLPPIAWVAAPVVA